MKTKSFTENLLLENFQFNSQLLCDFHTVKLPVSSRLGVSLNKNVSSEVRTLTMRTINIRTWHLEVTTSGLSSGL
jgi:hypothetical protein